MEPLFVPMDEAVSLNNVTSSYFLSSFHDCEAADLLFLWSVAWIWWKNNANIGYVRAIDGLPFSLTFKTLLLSKQHILKDNSVFKNLISGKVLFCPDLFWAILVWYLA